MLRSQNLGCLNWSQSIKWQQLTISMFFYWQKILIVSEHCLDVIESQFHSNVRIKRLCWDLQSQGLQFFLSVTIDGRICVRISVCIHWHWLQVEAIHQTERFRCCLHLEPHQNYLVRLTQWRQQFHRYPNTSKYWNLTTMNEGSPQPSQLFVISAPRIDSEVTQLNYIEDDDETCNDGCSMSEGEIPSIEVAIAVEEYHRERREDYFVRPSHGRWVRNFMLQFLIRLKNGGHSWLTTWNVPYPLPLGEYVYARVTAIPHANYQIDKLEWEQQYVYTRR